jgi:hypothetical protein
MIPENIRTRLEAFLAAGQTGQVVLNIRHGGVVSADIHVHLKAAPQKNLDMPKASQ